MNLNANYLAVDDSSGDPMGYPAESLAETIDEHHEILGSPDLQFTGHVALVTDRALVGTGAMQVWSETLDGKWAWVNPEGEIVVRDNPLQ